MRLTFTFYQNYRSHEEGKNKCFYSGVVLLIDVFQFSFPWIQNFKQRPQNVTHCGYQYLVWPFLQGTHMAGCRNLTLV